MGDSALFQDHHILPAHARQVIGDAAANDAAADDDDLGMGARGHEAGPWSGRRRDRIIASGSAATQAARFEAGSTVLLLGSGVRVG
jgi:hypothetical protein